MEHFERTQQESKIEDLLRDLQINMKSIAPTVQKLKPLSVDDLVALRHELFSRYPDTYGKFQKLEARLATRSADELLLVDQLNLMDYAEEICSGLGGLQKLLQEAEQWMEREGLTNRKKTKVKNIAHDDASTSSDAFLPLDFKLGFWRRNTIEGLPTPL